MLLAFLAQAQNLDKIGKKDMFTVNGGVAFNTVNYFASGMDSRRDPFTWFATGNINFNFLDVAVPLTYSYSNLGGKFTQPFNQFSLHPTYKWIKTHIGYHSMQFSNYTLAGHLFLGGAVELTPKGKWNLSAMGGRLNKKVEYDAVSDNVNQITYQRMGYGLKGGYKSGSNEINIILFKAQDDENSLSFIPASSTVKPQDNSVMSLSGKMAPLKNMFVEAEYALSVLTNNVRDEIETTALIAGRWLKGLMSVNHSTAIYDAYKASVGYKFTRISFSANYEHIDPGYATLGGYFFNNDLENYTLATNASLFKGKVNTGINAGFQYNNLDGLKAATTKRLVGSMNVSANLTQKINLNASYSNFSNFTRNRLQADPFYTPLGDTLNFYNQTQSASLASVFQFGKNKVKQNIQAVFNYNQSVNVTGGFTNGGLYGINAPKGVPMKVYTGNLVYGMQFTTIKLNAAAGVNSNYTEIVTGNTLFIGPMFNLSRTMGKFSLTAGSVYNRQYTAAVLSSNVFNHRLSVAFKPKSKNPKYGNFTMSCNAAWMQRLPTAEAIDQNKINEINIFTNAAYNF